VEVIDGTFEELAEGKQGMDLPLVVSEQRLQSEPKAAGAIGRDGKRGRPLYVIYDKNIKT
jgi:hypothetical protein